MYLHICVCVCVTRSRSPQNPGQYKPRFLPQQSSAYWQMKCPLICERPRRTRIVNTWIWCGQRSPTETRQCCNFIDTPFNNSLRRTFTESILQHLQQKFRYGWCPLGTIRDVSLNCLSSFYYYYLVIPINIIVINIIAVFIIIVMTNSNNVAPKYEKAYAPYVFCSYIFKCDICKYDRGDC